LPKTHKQLVGQLGEDVATLFLEKRGYKIVDRNYLKPWGEIDIVAKKGNTHHFVEVKSFLASGTLSVPDADRYEAEENVHERKMKRLQKVIDTYIDHHALGESDFVIDVVVVEIDRVARKARVRLIEDVAL
jgi:putative endonuclease